MLSAAYWVHFVPGEPCVLRCVVRSIPFSTQNKHRSPWFSGVTSLMTGSFYLCTSLRVGGTGAVWMTVRALQDHRYICRCRPYWVWLCKGEGSFRVRNLLLTAPNAFKSIRECKACPPIAPRCIKTFMPQGQEVVLWVLSLGRVIMSAAVAEAAPPIRSAGLNESQQLSKISRRHTACFTITIIIVSITITIAIIIVTIITIRITIIIVSITITIAIIIVTIITIRNYLKLLILSFRPLEKCCSDPLQFKARL